MERNQMSLIIFEVKSISFRFGLVAKIFDSVVSITYDIERKKSLGLENVQQKSCDR